MLFVALAALCAIVCTFFIGRFFAGKTRLVEQSIESAIARRIETSPMKIELGRLREQNTVMRNLLIDMLENEGSVTPDGSKSAAERDRALKARVQRRREIFGEAVFTLRQGKQPQKQDIRA